MKEMNMLNSDTLGTRSCLDFYHLNNLNSIISLQINIFYQNS